MAQLEEWSRHENCHVRRLASEGTRPRLPWTMRLPQFIDDPRPVLKILNNLKADPVLLVRRSVANNLNDIAKDNPDLVVETLREWQQIENEGTQWIIGHASRTLVKQGNKAALALLGYSPNPAIRVKNLKIENHKINLGDALNFSFEVQSTGDDSQNLMIDYIIHHMKANGKLSPKVFKLAKKRLKAGETLHISKNHSIKPITTRKYYPGQHRLEIQINGQVWADAAFELQM
jgi:3-methyladenine DNA glycosylase AlkC